MHKALLVIWLCCLLASLAVAETKISSTIKCGKNSIEQMAAVGDRPDHSIGVVQGSCTEVKPWTIAGVAGKEGVGTSSVEADGAVAKSHGVFVETMENGDKAYYHYELTSTTKDGQVQISGHKWQLVGGTGKLNGVKGHGTCAGSGTADGITYDCTGAYTAAK